MTVVGQAWHLALTAELAGGGKPSLKQSRGSFDHTEPVKKNSA